jgi:hypothetical protein
LIGLSPLSRELANTFKVLSLAVIVPVADFSEEE